jgi:hypothetical protein
MRSRLAERRIYLSIARRRYGHMVVGDASELLIDGFTRSACVYAAVAFQLAQPRPVRLAHLIHSPAHIIEGVRRGVPSMVTVRDPRGAVLSCLLREPQTTAGQVLEAHERFYRALLPYRERLVVAPFERVTNDLGGLVRDVNERFGTDFALPSQSPDAVGAVFDFIELRASRPPWEEHIGYVMSGLRAPDTLEPFRRRVDARDTAVPFEHRVARPSAEREAFKLAKLDLYMSPDLAPLRDRADRTYRAFVGQVDGDASDLTTESEGRKVGEPSSLAKRLREAGR